MASLKAVAVFVFVFFFAQCVSSKRTSDLKREILDQILPKNDNEILIAPGNSTNGATVVEVFTHVLSIDKLNEEKMDFTMRLILRQKWKDDRLKYDNSKGQIEHIMINDPDAIWTPDTFFSNEKKGHSFDITHPNLFLRLYPDGTVLYSRKVSITAHCLLNLRKFPFDKQECGLRIAAYGSTTDDIILLWRDYVPVTVSRSIGLPLFDLEKFVTYSGAININTGEYSYLTLSFCLSRTLSHYLYHIFLPYTMLVIISWIPSWLNKKIVTARIFISLSALLATALMIDDQNKQKPKIDYITCTDCFTGACLTLMFISLIETVMVHFVVEKETSGAAKSCTANGKLHKEKSKGIASIKAWMAKITSNTIYIDTIARFMLPLLYVVFCIIYFSSAGLGHDDNLIIRGNQTRETFVQGSVK